MGFVLVWTTDGPAETYKSAAMVVAETTPSKRRRQQMERLCIFD
jgi:hypothetical protein